MTTVTDVFNECSLGHGKIGRSTPQFGGSFPRGELCGHRVMLVRFGRGEHQL